MNSYIGVDLAWASGTVEKPANETGLVALADDGRIVDAGWARGLEDVLAYKHREDLIDAALAAWTAALWAQSPERVQVLGSTAQPDEDGRRLTIVAPAKPEQRRS